MIPFSYNTKQKCITVFFFGADVASETVYFANEAHFYSVLREIENTRFMCGSCLVKYLFARSLELRNQTVKQ